MSTERPITLDNRAVASNPGGVSISKFRWTRFYPKWPFIWTSLLVLASLAVFCKSFWFVLLLLPIVLLNILYWIRLGEHFRNGDANPGMIVSLNPTLVAVVTDLTKGVGSYPAVKIFRCNLKHTMGEPIEIGKRLPTVALYGGAEASCPYWTEFHPHPVECATTDYGALRQVMQSFSEEEWNRIEFAVQQLPRIEPGLHHFKPPASPAEAINHFVFAKIKDAVGPLERSTKYEQPLHDALLQGNLGKITGGGTMMSKNGEIDWIGLDIELVDLEQSLEFTREKLQELGAPEGSVLEYKTDGETRIIDI